MIFFCGGGSFSHIDDDPWSPSTPRRSRRKQGGGGGGGGGGGNPYSTRGLEKFSMVVADLEARREKIMAAAGSQGVAIVRFVYSSSDDWVPIVVRPREQPRPSAEKPRKGSRAQAQRSPCPPEGARPPADQAEVARDRAVRKSFSWKAGEGEGADAWRRNRSYYLPVAVALVLLCLAMSGRAFAICCTSIWWYSLPAAMKGGESREVTRSMKKGYGRRASERRLGATACGGDAAASAQARRAGGLEGLASPRGHHASVKRGSW